MAWCVLACRDTARISMNILPKILLAPAVAIAMLGLFGGLTHHALQAQKDALEELTSTRRSATQPASEELHKIDKVEAAVYRLFTWRATISEERLKVMTDEVIDKLEEVRGDLQGFRAQPQLLDEERARIDAILPRISQYRADITQAIEKSIDASSAATLMTGADATHDALVKELGTFAAVEKRLSDESFASAMDAADSATRMLMATAVAAVFCAALLSFLASRAIVRPLKRAIRAAQDIAAGDLTGDVRVHGADETAQLLTALSGMTGNLRGLIDQIASGAGRVAGTVPRSLKETWTCRNARRNKRAPWRKPRAPWSNWQAARRALNSPNAPAATAAPP
jgi:methyl-accepting chemotaxis protein